MKFIVVDDNQTFREGIKFYLENILNHTVIDIASNGLEFLNLPNRNEADIILMDIEMPHLNGIETVKKAIWDNQYLTFIAVTSFIDKAYLDELIEAGFKSCVFKSNIYTELQEAIKAVVQKNLFFPKNITLQNGNN